MTAATIERNQTASFLLPLAIAAVAVRPPGWMATVVVVAAAGAVAAIPHRRSETAARIWAACVVAGCGVFALVPLLWPNPYAPRVPMLAIGASAVAAVAEEFIFRRALFGALAARGPTVAVLVSAALFALAHVPNYGWGVVPIDFAAGLVFSWQRHASGSWTAPAVTHSFANLVQVL